jgi:hypothetical protein
MSLYFNPFQSREGIVVWPLGADLPEILETEINVGVCK